MENESIKRALSFYEAFRSKDVEGMAVHLDERIHFIGPLAEVIGRDSVLEGIQKLWSVFKKFTLRAQFVKADQVVVIYDLECLEPIGTLRVSALLTFEKGLIGRMELFFDARPFEKMSFSK